MAAFEHSQRFVHRVRPHIEPGRASGGCRLKQPFESRLHLQKQGFYVLAGAQAVDPKVHAIARELPRLELADFDRITETAAGTDAKVREDRMAWVEVGDAEFLIPRAPTPAVDFIFV